MTKLAGFLSGLKTLFKKTFTSDHFKTSVIEIGRTMLAIIIAYLVAFVVISFVSEDSKNAIRWFV
ncbi:MAG: hypothetical protein PHQ30_05580 [Candidatus Izemoplasmatales bacterium]|nr:hypothetical protein [Candidatus Izemoplasmatales bacterium]